MKRNLKLLTVMILLIAVLLSSMSPVLYAAEFRNELALDEPTPYEESVEELSSEEQSSEEDSSEYETEKYSEYESETATEIIPEILGDVDGNGIVNARDARLALRASAKIERLNSYQIRVADYDKNGKLSALDARYILRASAKLDPFATETHTVPTTAKPIATTTKKTTTATTTKKNNTNSSRKYKINYGKGFSTRYSKSALLYDFDKDVILYNHNMHSRREPASTTKLMTAYIGCKYLKANQVLTVGSELNLMEWNTSKAGIYRGMKMKFKDMLVCMLLPSGCDAAYTIAVNAARAYKHNWSMSASTALSTFVSMMNSTAKSLGMKESHFANPDGFPNSNHYVTPYDMLILGVNCYNISLIRNTVAKTYATAYYLNGSVFKSFRNTNDLINPYSQNYYRYCVGMKTGSHSTAGQCLVSVAKKNGRTFFGIVYYSESHRTRYLDLTSMYNNAFKNYA